MSVPNTHVKAAPPSKWRGRPFPEMGKPTPACAFTGKCGMFGKTTHSDESARLGGQSGLDGSKKRSSPQQDLCECGASLKDLPWVLLLILPFKL